MRKDHVKIDPFREWIKIVRNYYTGNHEFSKVIGMSSGKIEAILEDRPYQDGVHGKRRKIESLRVDTVDKAMTRDGHFHLVEFYPEAYEEN